jgi:choline dehydrogenase-like flavoprotein
MMPDMPDVGNITPDEFDVIIAGAGAGGGTLANTIAPSGKRVLLP